MPAPTQDTPDDLKRKRAILVLAEHLIARRSEAELTQQELSKRAGLGRDGVHRIEQAQADPKLSSIEAVADALGTTPGELLK